MQRPSASWGSDSIRSTRSLVELEEQNESQGSIEEDQCSVNRGEERKDRVNQSSAIDVADEALKDLLDSQIFISYLAALLLSRETPL